MKCLKCMKEDNTKDQKLKIPEALSHLNYWHVCDECSDSDKKQKADKASSYYKKNKKHYRDLHKKYKRTLVDSYVANAFVDRTDLKAVDVPKSMIKAKRGFMLFNRIIKAQEESENGNKSKKK